MVLQANFAEVVAQCEQEVVVRVVAHAERAVDLGHQRAVCGELLGRDRQIGGFVGDHVEEHRRAAGGEGFGVEIEPP